MVNNSIIIIQEEYKMRYITLCTSKFCPYEKKCKRKTRGDPNDQYQSYCNLEYICNEESGFDMFIHTSIERKR
jgi:hypothetical protein